MGDILTELKGHRVSTDDLHAVCDGEVRFSLRKFAWFFGMASGALIGGTVFFSYSGLLVFLGTTGAVLLFGHSLGSHRKLIHDSYACPKWLEYFLVYMGVQVGLAGPIGLLRAHELRDFAQRLPTCHDYLRHGSRFWKDAWWQLACDLHLKNPPSIEIEPRIAQDRFYRFLEASWMLQQVPPALLLYAMGGWSFVFFGVCARVTAGVFGHWLVGYFAHNDGGMHFRISGAAVQGRNIRLASILTMGECWHNNHHAYPGAARLGLFAGEWDPGWWMLMIFHRLGWAWNFRLPQDLRMRPELSGCDERGLAQVALKAPPLPNPLGFRSIWRELGIGQPITRVTWPAAFLNPHQMRALLGDGIDLQVDVTLDRLIVHRHQDSFSGLPAVCLALAQRGRASQAIAVILLPLAVGLENLRQGLTYRQGHA